MTILQASDVMTDFNELQGKQAYLLACKVLAIYSEIKGKSHLIIANAVQSLHVNCKFICKFCLESNFEQAI